MTYTSWAVKMISGCRHPKNGKEDGAGSREAFVPARADLAQRNPRLYFTCPRRNCRKTGILLVSVTGIVQLCLDCRKLSYQQGM